MKVSFNQLKKLLDSKQNLLHYHDHEFDKWNNTIELSYYSDESRKKDIDIFRKIGVPPANMKRSKIYRTFMLNISQWGGRAMDDDDKLALKHAHPADRAAYKRGY